MLRTQLIAVLLDKLAHQRQLLILSPRHGGARTLVRQMVARSDFAPDAITRLSPSALARTAADYFAALTGDPGVQTALGYDAWQRRRLRPGGERHLIVLSHDGGEGALLGELAEVLRGCQQDPRVHILVAGEARAAALKYGLGMRPRGLRDASSRFGDASSRFGNASSRFGWASSRLAWRPRGLSGRPRALSLSVKSYIIPTVLSVCHSSRHN